MHLNRPIDDYIWSMELNWDSTRAGGLYLTYTTLTFSIRKFEHSWLKKRVKNTLEHMYRTLYQQGICQASMLANWALQCKKWSEYVWRVQTSPINWRSIWRWIINRNETQFDCQTQYYRRRQCESMQNSRIRFSVVTGFRVYHTLEIHRILQRPIDKHKEDNVPREGQDSNKQDLLRNSKCIPILEIWEGSKLEWGILL